MDPLLTVTGLVKRFPVKAAPFRKPSRVHAVDGIDLTIGRGETVGLVGESGCGKSTLVRLLSRLLDPDEGSILFDGRNFGAVPARRFGRTADRAAIQMVFQDAGDSLNPRWSAFDCIADPLRRLRGLSGAALRERVAATAADCGLPRELLGRLPHQLSGGQKARVGIARAVAVEPKLLILDEPTAALDVSVQVVILRLLDELKTRLGMSYLFVSHDLNVVRLICDRVMVMYLGKMVEAGPADALFRAPAHPYTAALLSAIPGGGGRIPLPGEPRSPIDPAPTVCRFHGRCQNGTAACAETMPTLRDLGGGRSTACHFAEPATLDARIAAA